MATLAVVFTIAAAGIIAVYVMTPLVAPPPPSETAPSPAPAVAPPAATPSAPGALSRSRGRSDWLYFFKPGDWLIRMADDGLLGVVVRVEKTHAFPDGSTGPAYVVQSMEGEERVIDADELERAARLR